MLCADVVKDDPTNNVPDSIFTKLGMQLHMRDQHPLGIIKNAIYDYFDTKYNNKFEKFDDLCPIVSTKAVSDSVFGIIFCTLNIQTFDMSRLSCASFRLEWIISL